MVAQDHVLEAQEQFVGERLAGQVGGPGDLFIEHLDADHQVADKLALVGVGEHALVAQFAHLADVVQENAHEQQIAVDPWIERQNPLRPVEQRDDVLEQAAQVGMMVPDPGRHLAKVANELLVHQETFGQGSQVRIR